MATAKNKLSTDFQSAINCVPERSLLGAFGKQHHDYDHDVFNSAGSTLATPHFGPENGVHLRESDPFSRAPPRHVSAPKKDCPRTEVFSGAIGIECATRRSRNKVCRSVQESGGSVQDSSNASHEEVRNAMGRARRPSHSILPRSRAEQSLRASLDPARTYLQGGGWDSRQCRADTQLAMIGVSMRVTPIPLQACPEVS